MRLSLIKPLTATALLAGAFSARPGSQVGVPVEAGEGRLSILPLKPVSKRPHPTPASNDPEEAVAVVVVPEGGELTITSLPVFPTETASPPEEDMEDLKTKSVYLSYGLATPPEITAAPAVGERGEREEEEEEHVTTKTVTLHPMLKGPPKLEVPVLTWVPLEPVETARPGEPGQGEEKEDANTKTVTVTVSFGIEPPRVTDRPEQHTRHPDEKQDDDPLTRSVSFLPIAPGPVYPSRHDIPTWITIPRGPTGITTNEEAAVPTTTDTVSRSWRPELEFETWVTVPRGSTAITVTITTEPAVATSVVTPTAVAA